MRSSSLRKVHRSSDHLGVLLGLGSLLTSSSSILHKLGLAIQKENLDLASIRMEYEGRRKNESSEISTAVDALSRVELGVDEFPNLLSNLIEAASCADSPLITLNRFKLDILQAIYNKMTIDREDANVYMVRKVRDLIQSFKTSGEGPKENLALQEKYENQFLRKEVEKFSTRVLSPSNKSMPALVAETLNMVDRALECGLTKYPLSFMQMALDLMNHPSVANKGGTVEILKRFVDDLFERAFSYTHTSRNFSEVPGGITSVCLKNLQIYDRACENLAQKYPENMHGLRTCLESFRRSFEDANNNQALHYEIDKHDLDAYLQYLSSDSYLTTDSSELQTSSTTTTEVISVETHTTTHEDELYRVHIVDHTRISDDGFQMSPVLEEQVSGEELAASEVLLGRTCSTATTSGANVRTDLETQSSVELSAVEGQKGDHEYIRTDSVAEASSLSSSPLALDDKTFYVKVHRYKPKRGAGRQVAALVKHYELLGVEPPVELRKAPLRRPVDLSNEIMKSEPSVTQDKPVAPPAKTSSPTPPLRSDSPLSSPTRSSVTTSPLPSDHKPQLRRYRSQLHLNIDALSEVPVPSPAATGRTNLFEWRPIMPNIHAISLAKTVKQLGGLSQGPQTTTSSQAEIDEILTQLSLKRSTTFNQSDLEMFTPSWTSHLPFNPTISTTNGSLTI